MKSSWIGIGFSHHSVPSLSNTAIRSSAGTFSRSDPRDELDDRAPRRPVAPARQGSRTLDRRHRRTVWRGGGTSRHPNRMMPCAARTRRRSGAMSVEQRTEASRPSSPNGAASRYGNAFLLDDAPGSPAARRSECRPPTPCGCSARSSSSTGSRMRNLATFVTTWMEPEAQRVIADNLHRNYIDHAEYPQTAEIEQRCIRMLADLFHAPGETTGTRTQGSSEAIMLGALSLKWKWRARREAAGKSTDRPNLVFGGDVHVVWEKFCRYFDVEPRIIPLQPPQVHDRARGRRAARGREHDRGRRRARHDVHGPRRRHRRHRRAAAAAARRARPRGPDARRRRQRRVRVAVPVSGQRSGTSGSRPSARSTSPATSTGSCTRASAG